VARVFDFCLIAALKKRQPLLAWKLGVDRKPPVGELNHGVGTPATLARRRLELVHVRWQEICQQTLETRFAKLPPHMRELEKIIEIVDGVSYCADLTKLLFGSFQVLLDFFKLGEAFFDVLIQLLLDLLRDLKQLGVHPVADSL